MIRYGSDNRPPDQQANLFLSNNSKRSVTKKQIKQAKEGLAFGLKRLNKEDSFNIITFNNTYDLFSYAPLDGTIDNLNLAYNYISNLRADGGTEALGALTVGMEVTKSNKLDIREPFCLLMLLHQYMELYCE